jgi:hypothetical protein
MTVLAQHRLAETVAQHLTLCFELIGILHTNVQAGNGKQLPDKPEENWMRSSSTETSESRTSEWRVDRDEAVLTHVERYFPTPVILFQCRGRKNPVCDEDQRAGTL